MNGPASAPCRRIPRMPESGVDDARVTRVVVQSENKLCNTCVRAENSLARPRPRYRRARGTRPGPDGAAQGVPSVACHGGIRALPWLRAEPGANACADHRLEPARRQTALYHEGCAGSRARAAARPGGDAPDDAHQRHPDHRLRTAAFPGGPARPAAAGRRGRGDRGAEPRRGPRRARRLGRPPAGHRRALLGARPGGRARLRRAAHRSPRAPPGRPADRDAGVLREAAHGDRLEGPDQRPGHGRRPRRAPRPAHRPPAAARHRRDSACRWAANGSTRSRRSTSRTR